MATLFPTALDVLTNPHSGAPLHSPGHADQHINANDAIEALEARVGITASADPLSHEYRLNFLETYPLTAKKIIQTVVNNTGGTLSKGQVVYVSGSTGASGKLRAALSSNATEGGSTKTFGIMNQTLLNGEEGTVITEGLIENINTTGAVDGDPVWLGSTPGSKIYGLVNKPSAPQHLVFVGIVVKNGFELHELHNVSALNPSTGDTIRYNQTTDLWEKFTLNNFVTNDNLGNTLDDYVPIGDVGQPDGVASLDSTGNIPVTQLGNLIDGAPGALNTLNELAAALADDANYATTITNALALKAPLASPTFTGTVNLSSATVTGVISVVQQNGTALNKRPAINFLGGALVEDDLANNRINVTITGGIPELIDGGNFDSVSPYDGGAPDATTFENTFDAGEVAA